MSRTLAALRWRAGAPDTGVLSTSMARILHTITGLNVGGAELLMLRLLAAMDRARFEPSVLSLLKPGPVGARAIDLGIPVATVDMTRGLPTPSQALRLWRQAKTAPADIVQGWMYHGSLAGTLAWWRQGRRPRLAWNIRHSLSDLAHEPKLTQVIIRAMINLSRRPDAIIYCSQAARRQHEAAGFAAEKGVLIANGFDTALFRPDAQARRRVGEIIGATADELLLGVVARVDPMKDHANLLRAAALVGDGVKVRLVFVGRDATAENTALVTTIQQCGLGEKVSLLGQRDDVPKLMPGLDALVSPSAWGEAFPNAVAEAMASGVPAIVTDVGDSAWIVGDTGLVVPPSNSEALAAALRRFGSLPTDSRRDLAARARARVVNDFSMAQMTRNYEALYERLAER